MSRYLVLWESITNQWPVEPKERAAVMSKAKEQVRQNLSKGFSKSWGAFMTGGKGYSVVEGSPSDVYKELQKFTPYFTYEIHEVLSIDELP